MIRIAQAECYGLSYMQVLLRLRHAVHSIRR
jgi:hypothetical protein